MSRLLLPHVLVPISCAAAARARRHRPGPRRTPWARGDQGARWGLEAVPQLHGVPKWVAAAAGLRDRGSGANHRRFIRSGWGTGPPPGEWTDRGLTQRPTTDGSSEVVGVWGGASGGSAGRRSHIAPQRLNHKRSANVVGGLRCDRRSRRQVR